MFARALTSSAIATPQDEARARSLISRAYYAAFNTAKPLTIAKGYFTPATVKTRPKHGQIWQALQQRQCTVDERKAGELGDGLMDDRHEADYDIQLHRIANLSKIIHSAISRAETICTLLGSPPPTTAVPAVPATPSSPSPAPTAKDPRR